MQKNIAFLIMRVSLGVVFLLFGIGKFQNDVWAETIRGTDLFLKLPWDVNLTVFLIGAGETLTGTALILGLFTRFFSGLAAAQLLFILTVLRYAEIRDIGLCGAAAYMALIKEDSFGISWLWKKRS